MNNQRNQENTGITVDDLLKIVGTKEVQVISLKESLNQLAEMYQKQQEKVERYKIDMKKLKARLEEVQAKD